MFIGEARANLVSGGYLTLLLGSAGLRPMVLS